MPNITFSHILWDLNNLNLYPKDYDDQAWAEKLSRFIITLFGIVGLVWGGIIPGWVQDL